MTYRLPNPAVFQILTRSSQDLANSELLACVVGPLYQVVKDAQVGITFPVTTSTVSYANLKVGAVPVLSSVKLKVNNGVVKISADVDATASTMLTAGSNIATLTGAFANAAVGDVLTVSGSLGSFTITEKTSNNSVKLDRVSTTTTSAQTYHITRSIADGFIVKSTEYSADYQGVDLTAMTDGATHKFVSGDVFLSYTALRKDLTGFYEVDNIDTLAIDMDIDPLNPLGFYLGQIMFAASGGKNVLAYIQEDDTDLAFNMALEALETKRTPYMIVPLTTSSARLDAAVSHASLMSQPEISYFRAAVVNAPITLTNIVASAEHTA